MDVLPHTSSEEEAKGEEGDGVRELDDDLNENPNLAIFRQTDNGVLIRMALFALILDVADKVEDSAREVSWYTGGRFR